MGKQKEETENYIDIRRVMASKGIKTPGLVVAFLNRLLHVAELNDCINCCRGRKNVDMARGVMDYLRVRVEVRGLENIPLEGNPMVVGNHPLGGPDGMALIQAIGERREDIKFPVNDFLMACPGFDDIFVPIDKVHRTAANAAGLEAAFSGQNVLLYFPAGLCSRKTKGRIADPQWKPTFVKKAVANQRVVVPVLFEAKNRNRFYFIANLRKKLGIKFNFEMALLPGEMMAQRGNTFRLTMGKPIPYTVFDRSRTPQQWADLMHDFVYTLKDNPQATFPAK